MHVNFEFLATRFDSRASKCQSQSRILPNSPGLQKSSRLQFIRTRVPLRLRYHADLINRVTMQVLSLYNSTAQLSSSLHAVCSLSLKFTKIFITAVFPQSSLTLKEDGVTTAFAALRNLTNSTFPRLFRRETLHHAAIQLYSPLACFPYRSVKKSSPNPVQNHGHVYFHHKEVSPTFSERGHRRS